MSIANANFGFVFERPLALKHWRTIEMGADIPFEEQNVCPCDGSPLRLFAEHKSMQSEKTIRIGWCSVCNYLGYVDRPTSEWMARFYASGMWDSGKVREGAHGVFRGNGVLALLSELSVGKEKTICDIGCGYGEALSFLKERGFQNLSGVEYSPHRARSARSLGFPVMELDVPSAQVFLLNHVLEHLSNPQQELEKMSRMQLPGDYIIVAVPNVWGEVCMEILSFLPHLHAFSVDSLIALFGGFGYEAMIRKESGKEIAIAFQKTGKKIVKSLSAHSIDPMLQKFVSGLGLKKHLSARPRRLWWFRKADVGGQTVLFRNSRLDALYWKTFSFFVGYVLRWKVARLMGTYRGQKGLQSTAISGVQQSVPTAAPITILYEGNITLFYK